MPVLAESRNSARHLSGTTRADIPRPGRAQPARAPAGTDRDRLGPGWPGEPDFRLGGYPPRCDLRSAVRRLAPARAGRGRPAGVAAALGVPGRAGGRTAAGRFVPAGRDLAAGPAGRRAAHGGPGRAEPAGVVRVRAGVRGGLLLPAAVLGDQRLVVRVDGAGAGVGRHPGRTGRRAAAAAATARLAGRGGGLVGEPGSAAGPLPVRRVPLGAAGHEPGLRADGRLGRGRRGAGPQLRGRPGRRQPGLADPVRAGPPLAADLGPPGAGRGGHGRAGRGRRAAAGGSHRGREDGRGRGRPRQRPRGPATCRRSSTTPR